MNEFNIMKRMMMMKKYQNEKCTCQEK